ncbi:MAG: DUF1223 domain-containing protein [Pseudomonadota bacterium]
MTKELKALHRHSDEIGYLNEDFREIPAFAEMTPWDAKRNVTCMTFLFKISRYMLACLICFVLGVGLIGVKLAKASEPVQTIPKPVVELFTSQGCSSCPPADAYLGILSKRKDVIALTFHVDYWDYLGWKDTFASSLHSKRQRAYAKHRGDKQVYTPQIVLNGQSYHVGSYKVEVDRAIAKSQTFVRKTFLPISWTRTDLGVQVTLTAGENSAVKNGILWLALVRSSQSVDIKRGENSGRNITYYNVVRSLTQLSTWNGDSMIVTIPEKDYGNDDIDKIVVFLQERIAGPIIAAAEIQTKILGQ